MVLMILKNLSCTQVPYCVPVVVGYSVLWPVRRYTSECKIMLNQSIKLSLLTSKMMAMSLLGSQLFYTMWLAGACFEFNFFLKKKQKCLEWNMKVECKNQRNNSQLESEILRKIPKVTGYYIRASTNEEYETLKNVWYLSMKVLQLFFPVT